MKPLLTPLSRTVLAIAAPAVVELVLTSATSFADTIMVGRLGAYAISAVGLTTQPRFIMLATFIALNVGTTALVARFKGQGNRKDAEIVTAQSIALALLMALVLTVPGVFFARGMVLFMGANADTLEAATDYFGVLMMGFVPTVLSIAISALLRGVGDTKTSMRYNVIANVVNIVFNYFLIYGKFGFPRLGVKGAAIATVIGNCVGCSIALYAVLGRPLNRKARDYSEFIRLRLTRKRCVPNLPILRRVFRIGLPSAAEQIAMRAGMLIYTITITSLGTDVFAAHQIVLTILNLSIVVGQAFGIAGTTLTGQALGRGDTEGAKAASAACQRIGAAISTALGVLMFIFRGELMRMFTTEPDIVALGAGVMILAAVIQPFQSSFQIYSGSLRGAGDSLYPALSMAIGILGIRPLLSYILVHAMGWGLPGAWLALTFDQVGRFFFILIRYRRGKWVHTVV